jgi:hypothetical protein
MTTSTSTLARRSRIKSFQAASASSAEELRARLLLDQIRALIKHQSKLRPLKGELSDALFDRLMLSESRCYQVTRSIATEMNIDFEHKFRSGKNAFRAFDPALSRVAYSPIAQEVAWVCRPKVVPTQAFQELRILFGYSNALYHDLNHAILYRLVRPTKVNVAPKAVQNYFALIESLATMREIEFSRELGPASVPLATAGVVYYWLIDPEVIPGSPPTFINFRRLLLFNYFRILGQSLPQTKESLIKSGVTPWSCRFRGPSDNLVERICPRWMQEYLKRHGNRIALPAPYSRGQRISADPSKEFISDPRFIESIYEHYMSLFWKAS